MKTIKKFNLDTSNVPANGERRYFTIIGDKGAIFRLEIRDEDGKYYNFSSQVFQTAKSVLRRSIISLEYKDYIVFPKISDEDQYDIYLFAEASNNTKHTTYNEVRFADGSVDINSSSGSNSELITKVIRQYTSSTFTITALAPTLADGGEIWNGVSFTPDTLTVERRSANRFKKDFTVVITAGSGHSIKKDRNPDSSDVFVTVDRIIGSALVIKGEDTSGGNYRWSIKSNSSIHGLTDGMSLIGTNVTASTVIAPYNETLTVTEFSDVMTSVDDIRGAIERDGIDLMDTYLSEDELATYLSEAEDAVSSQPKVATITTLNKVHVDGVDTFGYKPTITKGEVTKQLGNLTFDKQQAAGLADDTVAFYAYGQENIAKFNGNIFKLSNLKVELTDVTTTVSDASATGSAALSDFDVASVAGIMDDVSIVTGVNIKSSGVNPTVTAISSSNLTVSPTGHLLQNGQTLVFKNAGFIATITGTIEILRISDSTPSCTFDVERFLTAV